MIAEIIQFVLTHLPEFLFTSAILIATFYDSKNRSAERYLNWMLLLLVGVNNLWAGLFHIFAPDTAAAFIGWQPSPFQFEIGVADTAIGIAGCLAFWRSFGFKAAVVIYESLFLAGVAIGHIQQIIKADNYSPGNGGALLVVTILSVPLLLGLLALACKARKNQTAA